MPKVKTEFKNDGTKEDNPIVLPFDVKAVGEPDADGLVKFEGYAAAFDNVDLGNDVIDKGAFEETIKADPNVPVLLDHYACMRETAGYNEAAAEDMRGLKVNGILDTTLEAGKIAWRLAKLAFRLGKQIGLSIGYGTKDSEYDPDTGIRTLKKLKLYEYSFTNFPMNPQATVTALKSEQYGMIKRAVKEILAENKDLLLTDDESTGNGTEDENEQKELSSLLERMKKLNGESEHAE